MWVEICTNIRSQIFTVYPYLLTHAHTSLQRSLEIAEPERGDGGDNE